MDCTRFRRRHLEYLDAELPNERMVAMRRHVASCGACSRFDVSLRRGLMVARSLGSIQPSARFRARLRQRLAVQGPLSLVPAAPSSTPAHAPMGIAVLR